MTEDLPRNLGVPGRLGCASEYEAYVTEADCHTRIASGRLGWTSIEWSRVLDDISTATLVLPDDYGGLRCCATLGGMVPWKYGIAIERNGEQVWCGPVTRIHRNRGDQPGIQVSCSDLLVRLVKRLAARAQFAFVNTDAGLIVQTLINEAAALDSDPYSLMFPDVLSGVTMDRTFEPLTFEYAYDVLRELMNSAVDMFLVNSVIHAWYPGVGWVYPSVDEIGRPITAVLPGRYDNNREMHHGLFTEDSFVDLPEWDIDGMQQGNSVWLTGADSGEAGFRRWWLAEHATGQLEVGVLDHVENSTLPAGSEEGAIVNDDVMQRHADSTLALRAYAPAVIEGSVLSERAPIRVDQLLPGALWDLDIQDACYGQLLTMARLKSVTVRVSATDSGVTESVVPTLIPPGFEET